MKLPFSFGTRLIFRLALPGVVATYTLTHPLAALISALGLVSIGPLDLGDKLVVGILVVFYGWLISALDMPIYMLLEGRRFWPGWLKGWMTKRQQKRLERLQQRASQGGSDAIEYHLKAAEYPLNEQGRPYAPYPTRLGNILTEHETYPTRKYGMDGVFYWYRVWQETDKDLRGEMDERQAVLDGLIYSSAVLYLGAVLHLLLAVGAWIESGSLPFIFYARPLAMAVAGYFLYRISLPGYVQYGHHFKALFDRAYSKIDLQPQLDLIAHEAGAKWVSHAKGSSAPRIVWRYLQWHRFRPWGADSNQNFEDVRQK